MRRTAITLAALIAAAAPAAASGGLWCDAKDQSLEFHVETGVSRGVGGGFFNLRGSLDIAIRGVPEDLRKLSLDNALVHSWLDGDEAKLQFYFERAEGDFASVDFVVETRVIEEGAYAGEYLLTVFASPHAEPLSAQGTVSCGAE